MRYRPAPPDRLRNAFLSLRAPDERAGEAIELAKLRIDGYTRTLVSGAPQEVEPGRVDGEAERMAWSGITALALGMHDAARAILGALGDAIVTAESEFARRLYLLLAGRYVAWTGDARLITTRHLPVIRKVYEALPPVPGRADGGTTRPRMAAPWESLLDELANTAEAAGDMDLSTAARARASLQPGAAGDAAATFPDSPGGAAWSAYSLDLPEIAGARWLAELDQATEEDAGDEAAATRAAAAVLPFMHGMLGAEPDATRHRLVLRPRVPLAWDRCQVFRIHFGDATITMAYEKGEDRHEFRLVQDTGAVPVRIIFEPALPVSELRRAVVDGQAATLHSRRVGDRVAAPIQIVLDHDRRLEFHGPPAA